MDFNENEDSLSLRVIDPMVGMYHVPWTHIQHTHGAKGVCHKPRDISLCILYQSGHCNAGKRCHQVHADPLYVSKMREIQKATNSCCALHGSDTMGNEMCDWLVTPVQGHPNTLRIYAKRSNKSLDVPKMQTGRTDYLEGLIRHTQQPQISIPLEKVCGLHQRSRCLYGQGCKNLHLCRDLWRDLLTHNKWLGEEPEIRKLKHLKLHHQEQSLGKDVINTELVYPNRVLGPDPSYWAMPNHYPNIQYPWITPPYAGPSIVGHGAPYVPFYGRPYVSTSVMVAPPVSQTVITTNTIIPQEPKINTVVASALSKEAVASSPTNRHTFFSSLSTDGKTSQNIWEGPVHVQQMIKKSNLGMEWNNTPMSLVYEGTQIDTNDRISPIGAPASPIWNEVDHNDWMDRDMTVGANDSREPSPAEWNVKFQDIVGGRGLLLPEANYL